MPNPINSYLLVLIFITFWILWLLNSLKLQRLLYSFRKNIFIVQKTHHHISHKLHESEWKTKIGNFWDPFHFYLASYLKNNNFNFQLIMLTVLKLKTANNWYKTRKQLILMTKENFIYFLMGKQYHIKF